MSDKILFVDDEPAVLEGYKRLLRGTFQIHTAIGGAAGLGLIASEGQFAVVVSDMRMPQMNGVQFLTTVKSKMPDAVRMVLTGYSDIDSAIQAVNEGSVFRFLTKPCSKEVLIGAISAGLTQHQLVIAERELLEKTLRGSVQALVEILSATNPAAFSKTNRLRNYVRHIISTLHLSPSWQYDVAAMLSQLGCVTLHPDTLEAIHAGQDLSTEERERYKKHPFVAWDMLSHIPRMEAVAWIVMQQMGSANSMPNSLSTKEKNVVENGSQILRAAVAYDNLIAKGVRHPEAIVTLRASKTGLELSAINALETFAYACLPYTVRMCDVSALAKGMTLDEDIRSKEGMLVVAKGQEISSTLALRLSSFVERGLISGEIRVREASAQNEPGTREHISGGGFNNAETRPVC